MSTALGITGTDTGVGKTVIAAALAATLVRRGRCVGVLKPVETGVGANDDPPDGAFLRQAAGAKDALADVCPFRFADPLAPLLAAERAGRPLQLIALDAAFQRIAAGRDVAIVEGAGGLLVPLADGIAYDTLFHRWQLDTVIVAANRLGALNHTLLTVRVAEAAGIHVAGIVLNTVTGEPPGLAASTNEAALRRLAPHLPVVAFPFVRDLRHIPALADAAESCGLLSVMPALES